MATSDEDLLKLAEAAQGGVTPIEDPAPMVPPVSADDIKVTPAGPEPLPLARQVPPGTPAVEGPVYKPPLAEGEEPPQKWSTPEDAAKAVEDPAPMVPPVSADDVKVTPVAKLVTGKPTIQPVTKAEAAISEAQGDADEVGAATLALAKAKSAERMANAEGADKQAAQLRVNQAEMQQRLAAQEVGRAKAQEAANKADQEFHDFKIHDLLAERTTGERILSNIFIGLGAAGEVLSGQQGNPALEKLKMLVDSDFKKQTAELGSLKSFSEMKRKGVDDLEAGYKSELATLGLKQAAAYDAVSAEARAQAIRNGATPEEAEANVIVAGTKEKAAQLKAKSLLDLEHITSQAAIAKAQRGLGYAQLNETKRNNDLDHIEALDRNNATRAAAGAKSADLNASQAKAYDFAGRLQQDQKILDKLGPMSAKGMEIIQNQAANDELYKAHPALKVAAIKTGTFKTDEQALKESGDEKDVARYRSGIRMATSSLRPDSGAAIGASEYLGWGGNYVPQLGDTPDVVESKRQARESLVRGQAVASGRPQQFGFDGAGTKSQGQATNSSAPVTPTAPRKSDAEIADAQAWVDANPKDARAAGVKAKIAAWKAGK